MANAAYGRADLWSERTAGRLVARVGALAVTLLVAGVLLGSAPASAADAVTVRIEAAGIVPQRIVVEPGGTVVWVNASGTTLSVTASDASFNSGPLKPGEKFQFAFTEARTLSYEVPEIAGVSGTIVVQAPLPVAATAPVPAAATPQFAYTGSATTFNGAIGTILLALGVGLVISARRFGLAAALTGLPFTFVPDDMLPSRRHRRLAKAHARRSARPWGQFLR